MPWLNPGLVTGSMVPLAAILFGAWNGRLGADPIAEAMNQLGLVALVFLAATLACTPVKTIWGWTWPMRLRRTLGLLAFFYASLHLATYVALDQRFDWAAIWADLTKRKFIYVGMLAFLTLVPLAATSTTAAVKRLGFKRWKHLHRLAYLAPVLGVAHFIWRVKRDVREPVIYGTVFAALIGVRLFDYVRSRALENSHRRVPEGERVLGAPASLKSSSRMAGGHNLSAFKSRSFGDPTSSA